MTVPETLDLDGTGDGVVVLRLNRPDRLNAIDSVMRAELIQTLAALATDDDVHVEGVQHDVLAWIRFLQRECPSRNNLRMMGLAAGATPIDHVDRIAAAYLAVMDRAVRASERPVVAV